MQLYRSLLYMVSFTQPSLVTQALLLGNSSTDAPFCHWETYVASGSPTLSLFGCVPTPQAGSTFYGTALAGTITSSSISSLISPSISGIAPSAPKNPTKWLIAGATTGGLAFLALLAILVWFFLSRRQKLHRKNAARHEMAVDEDTLSIPPPQYGHLPLPPPDIKVLSNERNDGFSSDQLVVAELPAEDVQNDSDLPPQSANHLSQTSWLALDMRRLDTPE
ncbi:MAG: hypothetical protein M1840_000951 [Geoglossum simile]|nr:MAG: hypothetical protein M1840_000951 [Geoglossum simile]